MKVPQINAGVCLNCEACYSLEKEKHYIFIKCKLLNLQSNLLPNYIPDECAYSTEHVVSGKRDGVIITGNMCVEDLQEELLLSEKTAIIWNMGVSGWCGYCCGVKVLEACTCGNYDKVESKRLREIVRFLEGDKYCDEEDTPF